MCPIAKTADRQSDGKNAKEYLMLADLMEYKFSEVN